MAVDTCPSGKRMNPIVKLYDPHLADGATASTPNPDPRATSWESGEANSGVGFRLKKLYQVGPVTGLHPLGENFWVGATGPELQIYHPQRPFRPLPREPINLLGCTRIHGFASVAHVPSGSMDRYCVVAYGGKRIRWFHLELEDSSAPSYTLANVSPIIEFNDWVLDVSFKLSSEVAQDSGTSEWVAWDLRVAFSHATVSAFTVRAPFSAPFAPRFSITWRATAKYPQPSLLYAAKFLYGDVVAFGTVFNLILVWGFNLDPTDPSSGTLIHRLVGHEGVIFGIDFDVGSFRLLSTSAAPGKAWIGRCHVAQTLVKRSPQLAPTLNLYGHLGRVWKARFLAHRPTHALSVAEDATCRLWELAPTSPNRLAEGTAASDAARGPVQVGSRQTWASHAGRNVWSFAVNASGTVLATGGGDGGIHLHPLEFETGPTGANVRPMGPPTFTLSLPPLDAYATETVHAKQVRVYLNGVPPLPTRGQAYGGPCAPPDRPAAGPDAMWSFVLVSPSAIVAGTRLGYVVELSGWDSASGPTPPPSNGTIRARPLYYDADLANYSVLATPAAHRGSALPTSDVYKSQLLAVGSKFGHLVLVDISDPSNRVKFRPHPSRVTHLDVCTASGNSRHVRSTRAAPTVAARSGDRYWVLSKDTAEAVLIHHVALHVGGIEVSRLVSGLRFALPLPRGFTLTALALDPLGQVVVCGSRRGALLAYDLSPAPTLERLMDRNLVIGVGLDPPPITTINASDMARDVHPNETVTCIQFKGSEVYSVGRDGAYAVHRLLRRGDGLKLTRVFHSRVTKGWVERIQMFYQKVLQVHDLTQNVKLLEVACGGAHRAWSAIIAGLTPLDATVAYFRHGQIAVHRVRPNHLSPLVRGAAIPPKLQAGFHGREIRATALLSWLGHTLLVTGAEDCSLRLSYRVPEYPGWAPILNIKKHPSAIFALAWSRPEPSWANLMGGAVADASPILFSTGGGGNLLAWRLELASGLGQLPLGLERGGLENSLFLRDMAAAPPVWLGWVSYHLWVTDGFGLERAIHLPSEAETPRGCVRTGFNGVRWASACPLGLGALHAYNGLLWVGLVLNLILNWVSASLETRILALTAFTVVEGFKVHFVAAGYSDGVARLWGYDSNLARFVLVAELVLEPPRCLMSVSHAKVTQDGAERVLLLAGASNGKLAVWEVTEPTLTFIRSVPTSNGVKLNPTLTVPIHGSAINRVVILPSPIGGLLVATGGEDTGLGLAHFKLFPRLSTKLEVGVELVGVRFYPMAHASAIQGMYPYTHERATHLVTLGLDQRLAVWEIHPSCHNPPTSEAPSSGTLGIDFTMRVHSMVHLDVPDPAHLSGLLIPNPESL
ncbi:WD repeat-containing protein 6 [Massospora cicadina]|nr:WD repeat-containing protein 6 [Massospora cicadina]